MADQVSSMATMATPAKPQVRIFAQALASKGLLHELRAEMGRYGRGVSPDGQLAMRPGRRPRQPPEAARLLGHRLDPKLKTMTLYMNDLFDDNPELRPPARRWCAIDKKSDGNGGLTQPTLASATAARQARSEPGRIAAYVRSNRALGAQCPLASWRPP